MLLWSGLPLISFLFLIMHYIRLYVLTPCVITSVPKGIATRMRNNSLHFGKRSPRIYPPHVTNPTPPSVANVPTTSLIAPQPSSLIPNPPTNSNNGTNPNATSPPNSPPPTLEHKDVLDPGFVFFHLRQMSFEKAKRIYLFPDLNLII